MNFCVDSRLVMEKLGMHSWGFARARPYFWFLLSSQTPWFSPPVLEYNKGYLPPHLLTNKATFSPRPISSTFSITPHCQHFSSPIALKNPTKWSQSSPSSQPASWPQARPYLQLIPNSRKLPPSEAPAVRTTETASCAKTPSSLIVFPTTTWSVSRQVSRGKRYSSAKRPTKDKSKCLAFGSSYFHPRCLGWIDGVQGIYSGYSGVLRRW